MQVMGGPAYRSRRSSGSMLPLISALKAGTQSATGVSLPLAAVLGRLRGVFAEDLQDNYKRLAASVVLSGLRLRVEVWVISAK
jgi:hypothetical protein